MVSVVLSGSCGVETPGGNGALAECATGGVESGLDGVALSAVDCMAVAFADGESLTGCGQLPTDGAAAITEMVMRLSKVST